MTTKYVLGSHWPSPCVCVLYFIFVSSFFPFLSFFFFFFSPSPSIHLSHGRRYLAVLGRALNVAIGGGAEIGAATVASK
jgi:hypothetical protein